MLAAESKAATSDSTDSPDINPNRSWNQIMEQVNPFLHAVTQRLIHQANDFDPQIVPYAQSALNGSGKHLRPTLVALAGAAVGKVGDAQVTAAVIIEMVHLATLVHDDVMDEAEIRRGQLTLAANWGNEIAVLFGDCLFAQALKLAASFPTHGSLPRGRDGDEHGLHRRNFADAASPQFSAFPARIFSRHRNEDRRAVHAFVRSGGVFGRCQAGTARGVAANSARRSARRIRFMTIAWICSARRRRRANRSARIWRRAS